MTDNFIPDDITQFILQNIDSIAQLEGLFLLRAEPKKEWSAKNIAQRLYISEREAAILMERLAARGLIVAARDNSLYRYQPSSAALEQMTMQLADLYSRYLVPITHIIHSKPKTRMQEFADAFRIKKE